MDNYNYPAGADNSDAPWNQIDEEYEQRYFTMTEEQFLEVDVTPEMLDRSFTHPNEIYDKMKCTYKKLIEDILLEEIDTETRFERHRERIVLEDYYYSGKDIVGVYTLRDGDV